MRIYGIWKSQIWNPEFLENARRSESDILLEPTVTRGSFWWMFSRTLKSKSESLTRKLQIWTRIFTNHSLFIGNFKISTIIYENQLFFERKSKIWTRLQKIIGFSKENWHRGGTEKIEKSAGRAASAIGVLRIFKSGVFAWRFFDFFGTATNEMQVFRTKMT